ncbi:hypothetical protein [Xylanimonas protaetiae]|nr:hypothetical protein [Xylanimonas protaetiae]
MAEAVQNREEAVLALQSCLDAKGWAVTVLPDASVVGDKDEDSDRFDADFAQCSGAGEPVEYTESTARQEYGRWVDVAACLRAQGRTVSEAPSEDTWVDLALKNASGTLEPGESLWLPYLEVAPTAELEKECPQPWF